MPRALSTAFLRAHLDPHSSVRPLIFVDITHPALGTPIRVVNDWTELDPATAKPVPYRLSGADYQSYPFELELFGDADEAPRGRIAIQNVDRRIGRAIDAISSPAGIRIAVYSSADFELNGAGTLMVASGTPTLQYVTPARAVLREIEWDAVTVRGTIEPFNPTLEPWPYLRATPDVAPALWL